MVCGWLALFCAGAAGYAEAGSQTPSLEEIASGKTRVIDLSYAINDHLVSWPGDAKAFEAKTYATVGKEGYFTRSFWMLEHYGTHMDAPAHFPPGKYLRVTVSGGTLTQAGSTLAWDDHGFYEVSLDAGTLTLSP